MDDGTENGPEVEVITVGGVEFELRPFGRDPGDPGRVCLRKPANFVDRYLELATEFAGCRMVEVGVDRGGGTSFFAMLLKPRRLTAIELSKQPVPRLLDFLRAQSLEASVDVHWGTDQGDMAAVAEAVGPEALDLVVDDASHLLGPTTATFEELFPRLRPGGVYVIEDWSAPHLWEFGIASEIERDPEGALAKSVDAAELSERYEGEKPMSKLITQLVLAVGRHKDWIEDVRVMDGFCEVRRGPGEIAPRTPIATYIGRIGASVYEA